VLLRTLQPRLLALVAFVTAGLTLVVVGCGTEPPPGWQWWTGADTAAVKSELTAWRARFDANRALVDSVALNLSFGLTSTDSASTTGATLYKFAHLVSFQPAPAESGHADSLHFGVAVDTIAMTDTFCQVDYWDTLASTHVRFTYDSLWAVTFRPDTQPDSSIIWRVVSSDKSGFAARETTKSFDWRARRVVFMPKDSGRAAYAVARVSGFASFVPSALDAPGISSVVFTRPGHVDTFFYSVRLDGRGLYNLKPLDSLYTVQAGERVDVVVNTSTPADTTVDLNRFFLSGSGAKLDITVAARQGAGSFSFADTGLASVYVEVVPRSSLAYKDAAHKSTIWAIPVRVR
jgi:hypothetical protein